MAMTIWLKMPRSKTGFALAYRTGVNKGPGFWFAVFLSLLSKKPHMCLQILFLGWEALAYMSVLPSTCAVCGAGLALPKLGSAALCSTARPGL